LAKASAVVIRKQQRIRKDMVAFLMIPHPLIEWEGAPPRRVGSFSLIDVYAI